MQVVIIVLMVNISLNDCLPHQIFMTKIKSLGAGLSVQRKNICVSGDLQCMSQYVLIVYSICGYAILYASFTIM